MTKFFISFFTIFSFHLMTQAQTFTGAVSSGTGGAGRAVAGTGDSSFLNPATLPFLRGYYFYSSYSVGEMVLGLSDNTPDAVIPAAFSYYRHEQEQLQDFRLSLAEFASRKWSVGLSGHYFQLRTEEKSYTQGNVDFGVIFAPRANLGFGLVFYNLLGEPANFPEPSVVTPQAGLGVNYIYREYFRMKLDVLSARKNDVQNPIIMAGIESYMNRWMLTRFGYRDDNSIAKEFLTAGLGLDLPRFKLNYSYESDIKASSNSRHSVDLAVPFW